MITITEIPEEIKVLEKKVSELEIRYEHHCSSYNEHPPCEPPCTRVRARVEGMVSEWFNPHFVETIESLRLPIRIINKIKADFAPKVWGVDLHIHP